MSRHAFSKDISTIESGLELSETYAFSAMYTSKLMPPGISAKRMAGRVMSLANKAVELAVLLEELAGHIDQSGD